MARKGFVVVEDDGKFSCHCYLLRVPSTTKIWFTIQGTFQGEFIYYRFAHVRMA